MYDENNDHVGTISINTTIDQVVEIMKSKVSSVVSKANEKKLSDHISGSSENGFIPNSPMTWGAQLHKGNIFYSDFNTGVGALKLLESSPDNSNVNQVKTDQTFESALGVKNLLELFEYLASPPKE